MLLSRESCSSYKISEKLKKGKKCLKILIRRLHVNSERVNKLGAPWGTAVYSTKCRKRATLLMWKREKLNTGGDEFCNQMLSIKLVCHGTKVSQFKQL